MQFTQTNYFVFQAGFQGYPILNLQFDLDPPSYQQVTAVIRKMKASGSPCLLDQISIISFKRCAYIRTYLTELVRAVWQSGSIPSEWKKVCTILIHKKATQAFPQISDQSHLNLYRLKYLRPVSVTQCTPFSPPITLWKITYRKVLPLTCLALWNILHKWLIL